MAIKIEASTSVKVQGLAYAGGKMQLPGWRYMVVVDLQGLSIPDRVPLLANHENRTSSRVGLVHASVEDGSSLTVEGEILSSGGTAQGIIEQAKAGGDWQLSIGAQPMAVDLVQEGSREVNGMVHAAPFYHVQKADLREVSVVAIGAEGSTRMQIAAAFNLGEPNFLGTGRKTMDEKQGKITVDKSVWQKVLAAVGIKIEGEGEPSPAPAPAGMQAAGGTGTPPAPAPAGMQAAGGTGTPPAPAPASVQAAGGTGTPPAPAPVVPDVQAMVQAALQQERESESQRRQSIQAACKDFPEVAQQAIVAGWDLHQTREKLIEAMHSSMPQKNIMFSVGAEHSPQEYRSRLEAAMCMRSGFSGDELLKEHKYPEEVVEAAYRDREMSLPDVLRACLQMEGHPVGIGLNHDMIRASFSTVSLLGILNNVAGKRLARSYKAQRILAPTLCSDAELSDFKKSERYRLTDVGDLELIPQDGVFRHGGLTEEKATNQLETFGKSFSLTREMIYNDDLNSFLKIPDGMGARSARLVDQLFFRRLLANPGGLFSDGHRNYIEGTSSALSPEAMAEAIKMFMHQVDADGQPIAIEPKYLLVPTGLKMLAREILNSSILLATGTDNKRRISTYNALADEGLTVLSSPYLSHDGYTGNSEKAWYLFADPAVTDTFEIAYLRGHRTPIVEKTETDFERLGIRFRVYWDIGIREQDYRGMVKSKGAA